MSTILRELNAKLDRILQFGMKDDEEESAIKKTAKTGLMIAGGLALSGGAVKGALAARRSVLTRKVAKAATSVPPMR